MSYDPNLKRLPDPFYNNGLGFISAGAKGIYPGTQHALNSGSVVSVQYSGSYWEIDLSFPETLADEAIPTLAFLEGLNGSFTPFYVMLPQYRYPRTGAWDVSSAALRAEGDIELVTPRKIKITSWSTRGGDLSLGDMIKFTNMSKIYRITDRVYNSSEDSIELELSSDIKYPSLLAVAGLEPNDILFRVRLKNNKTPGPVLGNNGIYSGFSISLREDILDE